MSDFSLIRILEVGVGGSLGCLLRFVLITLVKYVIDKKRDVDVLAFDQTNESTGVDQATTGTKYIDTFPTSIEAITMAWDNTNQLGQFNVSFVCRKWQAI